MPATAFPLVEVIDAEQRPLLQMPWDVVQTQSLPHKVLLLLLKAKDKGLFAVNKEGALDVPFKTIVRAGTSLLEEAETLLNNAFGRTANISSLGGPIQNQHRFLYVLAAALPKTILEQHCTNITNQTDPTTFVLLDKITFAAFFQNGADSDLTLLQDNAILNKFLGFN